MPANVILSRLVVYFFLPLSVLFTTLSRSQGKKSIFPTLQKCPSYTESHWSLCVRCGPGGMCTCVRDNEGVKNMGK